MTQATAVPDQDAIDGFCKAAGMGVVSIVEDFIALYPGSVDAKATNGETALMRAAWHQKQQLVDLLLAHHADIHAVSSRGWTALIMAAWKGDTPIVGTLLKAGAAVNVQSNEGLTALMVASNMGREETVIRLLRENPDDTLTDKSGFTARQMAFERGYPKVVRLLDRFVRGNQKEGVKILDESERRLAVLRVKPLRSPFGKGPKP